MVKFSKCGTGLMKKITVLNVEMIILNPCQRHHVTLCIEAIPMEIARPPHTRVIILNL